MKRVAWFACWLVMGLLLGQVLDLVMSDLRVWSIQRQETALHGDLQHARATQESLLLAQLASTYDTLARVRASIDSIGVQR